ncbi:matrixin family metalloprotease [Candidatus Uabimicrobium sp. HlEnr_7]|uniref:matrixin family metalloprotease n=1 Tax=Candidatus Uabimicrobium helgolandensis TaxID=3095367 RepID=UPI003556F762
MIKQNYAIFILTIIFVSLPLYSQNQNLAQEYEIRLQNRTFTPTSSTIKPLDREQERHWVLVQFNKLHRNVIFQFRLTDIRLLGYVARNTLLLSVPSQFDWSSISSTRWVGKLKPSDKISKIVAEKLKKEPWQTTTYMVEGHRDVTQTEMKTIVEKIGAKYSTHPDFPSYACLVSGNASNVHSLSESEKIAWILPTPQFVLNQERIHYCAGGQTFYGPIPNFAVVGNGWDGNGLGEASLTYHFVSGGGTGDIGGNGEEAPVEEGIREWGSVVNISFDRINTPNQQNSFDIFWGVGNHGDNAPFDGQGNTVAHAFFPIGGALIDGDIHFDDAENWNNNFPNFLFNVTLHESGHALGMDHSDLNAAIMFPVIQNNAGKQPLDPDDIAGIRTLYSSVSIAPSSLNTTVLSSTEVDLNWNDNDNIEDGFRVERRIGGGNFEAIASVAPNEESFSDENAPEGSNLTYRIIAFNRFGDSVSSNNNNVLTLPADPNNLAVAPASATQIDLSWSDNSNGESNYRIERDLGGGFQQIALVGANTTNFSNNSGLGESTVAFYRVTALNATGDSGTSNVADTTTLPQTPNNLSAETFSDDRIDLSWNDNSNGENGYVVEREEQESRAFTVVANLNANTTVFSDINLPPSTTFNYRVRAFNAGGDSFFSNQSSTTTDPKSTGKTVVIDNKGDSGKGSLREAIEELAVDGDIIVFNKVRSITLLSEIAIDKSVVINGKGLTLSGKKLSRIFNIAADAEVKLLDIKFKDGNAGNNNGGAIFVASGGILDVDGCSFTNCKANKGGAIYLFDASAIGNLTNCIFKTNTASTDGGAIFVSTANVGTLVGNSFDKNSASDDGGAINNEGTIDTISTCIFKSNFTKGDVAESQGGAIFNNNGTINDISNCTFSRNKSFDDGGALFIDGGTINVFASKFDGNTVTSGSGGAIHNEGNLTVLTSNLAKNSTPKIGNGGGAIFNLGTINEISDTTFSINKTLANNGAAIFNNGTITLLQRNNFEKNNSANNGGAIFNSTGRTVTDVINCTFSANIAKNNGGAIFNGGTAKFTHCTFFKNKATSLEGGAIFVDNGNTTMEASVLVGNIAKVNGKNVLGNITTGGFNIVEDISGSGGFNSGQGDVLGGFKASNILISSLKDNGGETKTHALTTKGENPAIDAVPENTFTEEDQRGASRTDGNNDDSGAFESGVEALVVNAKIDFKAMKVDGYTTIKWENSKSKFFTGFHIWRRAVGEKKFTKITPMQILSTQGVDEEIGYSYNDVSVVNDKHYIYKLECLNFDKSCFSAPIVK